jgi:hypothetical protein
MNDLLDWLPAAVLVALGGYLAFSHLRRKAEQRRRAEQRADLDRRREQREDRRPTMVEAFNMEVDSLRRFALTGDDLTLKENAIFARLQMEDDLGRYAEGLPPIELDQAKRDLLLANARRDAAEALANIRSLMQEVRSLQSTVNEVLRYSVFAMIILVAVTYWRKWQ